MDYQLKLLDDSIVRPIRLEMGGQVAIIVNDKGEERGVPRSHVKEIIYD